MHSTEEAEGKIRYKVCLDGQSRAVARTRVLYSWQNITIAAPELSGPCPSGLTTFERSVQNGAFIVTCSATFFDQMHHDKYISQRHERILLLGISSGQSTRKTLESQNVDVDLSL